MDDLGNRQSVTTADAAQSQTANTYAVNNLTNRYDATADGSNNIEIAYDAAGNTTVDQNGYQYIYDYENRIRYIKKNSGSTNVAFIRYDALGRRIHKTDYAAGKSNLYYYNDKWQVLQEYNIQTPGNRYVYGNYIDEVLIMDDGTDKYYYAHNHLFSPVALLDDTGAVVERYEYNAYGKAQVLTDDDEDGNWFDDADDTIYAASQLGNPYLFTGRRLDSLDSGSLEIMYYRNRYYSTETGRFLTQDPLGVNPAGGEGNPFRVMGQYTDGLSLYEYVRSRPLLSFDPFGLEEYQAEYRIGSGGWYDRGYTATYTYETSCGSDGMTALFNGFSGVSESNLINQVDTTIIGIFTATFSVTGELSMGEPTSCSEGSGEVREYYITLTPQAEFEIGFPFVPDWFPIPLAITAFVDDNIYPSLRVTHTVECCVCDAD